MPPTSLELQPQIDLWTGPGFRRQRCPPAKCLRHEWLTSKPLCGWCRTSRRRPPDRGRFAPINGKHRVSVTLRGPAKRGRRCGHICRPRSITRSETPATPPASVGRLLEDSIVESPSLGTVLNGIAVIRYEVDTGTQVKGRE